MEKGQLISIGPKRGASLKKRWDPKEWKPEYEIVALYAAMGLPHAEIEKRTGYTQPWISSILNSVKGKVVRQLLVNKIREEGVQHITTERIQKLQAKAFTNIEKVIENEDLLERSPMAIFGASMEILKKSPVFGEADKDKPVASTVNNQQVNFFGVSREEINKSLEVADKVKEINALPSGKKDG